MERLEDEYGRSEAGGDDYFIRRSRRRVVTVAIFWEDDGLWRCLEDDDEEQDEQDEYDEEGEEADDFVRVALTDFEP
jgi:hypothetical protein